MKNLYLICLTLLLCNIAYGQRNMEIEFMIDGKPISTEEQLNSSDIYLTFHNQRTNCVLNFSELILPKFYHDGLGQVVNLALDEFNRCGGWQTGDPILITMTVINFQSPWYNYSGSKIIPVPNNSDGFYGSDGVNLVRSGYSMSYKDSLKKIQNCVQN